MKLQNLCMGCMEDKGGLEKCPDCGFVETSVSKSPNSLKPRTILQDKYLVGNVLGQGGFAITYLAWDINLGIKLAIKEYFPLDLVYRNPGNEMIIARSRAQETIFAHDMEKFLQEARILARFMDHPNIVSVTDFFQANRTAYLVMHYIEGVTLRHYLNRVGGKLPFDITMEIIMPVMDALRVIHDAGLLHRDISPENIIISLTGRIMLIDFGAAKHSRGEKNENVSVVMKPGYTPEEQYRSNGVQDPRTDVYAVAATIYRSITGRVPPNSLDRLANDYLALPSQLGAAINRGQEQALLKALSVFAADRFRSVAEFQEALILKEDFFPDYGGTKFETGPWPEHDVLEQEHQDINKVPTDLDSTDSGDINIGRSADNDLILEDITVSRHHARIFSRYGKWYIADLDSTCGTFLNDTRVSEPTELSAPAEIRLSEMSLYFDEAGILDSDGNLLYGLDKRPESEGVLQGSWLKAVPGTIRKIPSLLGYFDKRGMQGQTDGVVNIGRSPKNDLVINEETISRFHFRLYRQGGKWHLCDLQSTHGTIVNNLPVQETVELSPGDTIMASNIKVHFDGKNIVSNDGKILYNLSVPSSVSDRETQDPVQRIINIFRELNSGYIWILLACAVLLIIILILILIL